jgi:CDP-diglyceride synthetase
MNNLFETYKLIFCISGTIFILMFLIKSSTSYQQVLNSKSYNEILKLKKIEGFIFGASLATVVLMLIAMTLVSYEPTINYLVPSIDTTIN